MGSRHSQHSKPQYYTDGQSGIELDYSNWQSGYESQYSNRPLYNEPQYRPPYNEPQYSNSRQLIPFVKSKFSSSIHILPIRSRPPGYGSQDSNWQPGYSSHSYHSKSRNSNAQPGSESQYSNWQPDYSSHSYHSKSQYSNSQPGYSSPPMPLSGTSSVGSDDDVRSSGTASPRAGQVITPPTSPPREKSSRTGLIRSNDYDSPRTFKNDVRSSEIAPSELRTPPPTPPRNQSASTPKKESRGRRNHIDVSGLRASLCLNWTNPSRCWCIKDDGEECWTRRSKDTVEEINIQLESMMTLTRSSPEFESELEELVKIANCHWHQSPKFKDRRIEALTMFFPEGDGDTKPSVEKQIRKAIGELSTQCIGRRCEERVGGRKVLNCSKTIDEIVKPEVYLDDDYLDWFLRVLEENMYCQLHNRGPYKRVAQWKSSILEIRKKANSNALVLRNRRSPTPRRARSLTPDLDGDPAAFWPKTYDTTPFDILSRSNRLDDYKSSYHLIQSKLNEPLDLDKNEQLDGYVYLYGVEGNNDFVKLGYTGVSVEERLRGWEFNCNRDPRALYPNPSRNTKKIPFARRVEALCHAELDHCRIRIYCKACLMQHIEWFEIDPAEAIAVIRKWSKWAATLPYERPRLRSEKWELKEEERQEARNIRQFMKELKIWAA